MIRIFLALSLVGCVPSFNHDQRKLKKNPLVLVNADTYLQNVGDGFQLSLKISNTATTLSQMQKMITMIEAPTKEHLSSLDNSSMAVPIHIKRVKDQNIILMTRKARLKLNTVYGIYLQQSYGNDRQLIYAFRTTLGPPKIIRHNLGDNSPRKISQRRHKFEFTFDQPIEIEDDRSIIIHSHKPHISAPSIKKISISVDKRILTLQLENKLMPFQEGQLYTLILGSNIMNAWGESLKPVQLDLLAVKDDEDLVQISPLVVSRSDHAVDMVWRLSKDVDLELYFREVKGSATHDSVYSLVPSSIRDYIEHGRVTVFGKNLFISGLKNLTSYEYILRGEDARGEVMVTRGSFSTTKPSALKISEIMIDPPTKSSEREALGEYIEITNISDEEVTINDVHLRLQDRFFGEEVDCALTLEQSISVPRGGYFLITSAEFFPHMYNLGAEVIIARVKQKTLCKGLSNNRPKVVTIHYGDGNFVDRYGSYLWPAEKGRAIQRINVMGLDEANNYCYSSPTPGQKNGQCG